MRLLVTRPRPDADETAEHLRALGHDVIVAPLTVIDFAPEPEIGFRPAALLFTSRNGVRAASRWPIASGWRDIAVFAVGDRTATAAREAGFGSVRAAAGDVSALAGDVAASLDPFAGRLLHVAGRDRAGDLEGMLAERGFDIVTVEAYAAKGGDALSDKVRDALASGAIDGALFLSRRASTIFARLVSDAGLEAQAIRMTFFAISEAAAQPLRRFGPVLVAKRPDAGSVVALIGR
ncbi:MAG: uroporphyrinogen-III synthase [Notoacmeibacter sp.]|nr:uroporphyrinogen-III synthase [Notoacmeibacter sp.]